MINRKILRYLIVSSIIVFSCQSNPFTGTDENYFIVDSLVFDGYLAQYMVNSADTNYEKMYEFGLDIMNRNDYYTVVGFFYNIEDSLKFNSGALPDGVGNKLIGKMEYDSIYCTYVLHKYDIFNDKPVYKGLLYYSDKGIKSKKE